MSHFTTIELEIRDTPALVAALEDLGLPNAIVDEAATFEIRGYARHRERANVAVRGVGIYDEDIGFLRTGSGTYRMIADEGTIQSWSLRDGRPWPQRLAQAYAVQTTVRTLARQGFTVQDSQAWNDGRIVLRMQGRA